MKRSMLLLGLLVLVLVSVAMAAVDLSGTWAINKEKSDVPMGRGGQPGTVQDQTLTIKQSGNDLTITTTTPRGEQTAKYTLDGKESKNPGGRGGESVSKATVEGDTVVIETTMDMGRGPMTSKTVYALSDGGKVLTMTRTMGERSTKSVFDKK